MTALEAIKQRWTGAEQGYRQLSFERAKDDMDWLVAEIERLHNVEKEKEIAEAQLKEGLLRYKNLQQQLVHEIEGVVRKYDTF